MNNKPYLCIAEDLDVGEGATVIPVTHYTPLVVPLHEVWAAILTCYVKGANAGSTGNVTFNFQTYDSLRNSWDTIPFQTVVVALNGITYVQKSIALDGIPEMIRLGSIVNADATYHVTVNAMVYTQ